LTADAVAFSQKPNSNSNSLETFLFLGSYATEIDYAAMWNAKCQDLERQVELPLSKRLHARLERLIDSGVLTSRRWLEAIEQNGSMPSFDAVLASVEAQAKPPP
jgi:hypothetical protein